MHDLEWLVGYPFQSVIRRDHDWVFAFGRDASITASCLWRLVQEEGIRVTGDDDGHPFGLSAPTDAAQIVRDMLTGQVIQAVDVQSGTLDIALRFLNGSVLQFISNSCGYEPWQIARNGTEFVATGGKLVVFENRA